MKNATLVRRARLAESLRQAPIFSGLGESDIRRVVSYATVRLLEKDEILFREGEAVSGFFVLRKGMIKAYRASHDGREQLIHLIHPGESFAEPAVAGLPGYPAHTRALVPSEVILIEAKAFLRHLHEQPDLAMRMLASLSRHLHGLVETIENYKLRDAEARLLHWLLARCGPGFGPAVVVLHSTKTLLASELGTRPETLSRLLAKLRDEGHLKVRGRKMEVRCPLRLREKFESHLRGPVQRIPSSDHPTPS